MESLSNISAALSEEKPAPVSSAISLWRRLLLFFIVGWMLLAGFFYFLRYFFILYGIYR